MSESVSDEPRYRAAIAAKNTVHIPTLGMIDDLATISKCGSDSIISNAITNKFVESKRLELGSDKCNRIHISSRKKETQVCPELKVHDRIMNNSDGEKYIGDIITGDGKNITNILSRKSKGFAIAGDILAILEEVPFGTYKIEAGLVMRNAMLINGMLTNSETWYNLTENDVSHFEEVDKYLLRKILNAHSKTPIEMLYLETGAIPIRYVIKQRRISYLHHLLTRKEHELIYKVYMAQKRKSVKGDWAVTVKQDLNDINFNITESQIRLTKKKNFKDKLKQKIEEAFLYISKKLRKVILKLKKSHIKS